MNLVDAASCRILRKSGKMPLLPIVFANNSGWAGAIPSAQRQRSSLAGRARLLPSRALEMTLPFKHRAPPKVSHSHAKSAKKTKQPPLFREGVADFRFPSSQGRGEGRIYTKLYFRRQARRPPKPASTNSTIVLGSGTATPAAAATCVPPICRVSWMIVPDFNVPASTSV
jgi:hypothetical protein